MIRKSIWVLCFCLASSSLCNLRVDAYGKPAGLKADGSENLKFDYTIGYLPEGSEYLLIANTGTENLTATAGAISDYHSTFLSSSRSLNLTNSSGSEVALSKFKNVFILNSMARSKTSTVLSKTDIESTVLGVSSDGSTFSYFKQNDSPSTGFYYAIFKEVNVTIPEGYAFDRCLSFSDREDSKLQNLYCFYIDNAKSPTKEVLYADFSNPDAANIQLSKIDGIKRVYVGSSMVRDGRQCFLYEAYAGGKSFACVDGKKGLSRNKDNELVYYFNKQIRISALNETCFISADTIDIEDARFLDVPVFTCAKANKKIAAIVEVPPTGDKDEVSKYSSFTVVDESLEFLCIGNDYATYYDATGGSIVSKALESSKSKPGEVLNVTLDVADGVLVQARCGKDNIFSIIESGKKKKVEIFVDVSTPQVDSASSSARLLASQYNPQAYTGLSYSYGTSALIYSVAKDGSISGIMEYNRFVGLLRLFNSDVSKTGTYSSTLKLTDGTETNLWTVQTAVINEGEDFTISKEQKKPFKDLAPGHTYKLREYFDITGKVKSIESTPKVHSIYWLPDQVLLENEKKGSAASAVFSIDNVFVNTFDKTYLEKDGNQLKKLTGEVLSPARLLGVLDLDVDLALVANWDEHSTHIQGWFINKDGVPKGTQVIETPLVINRVRNPIAFTYQDKPVIAIFQDFTKAYFIEYFYDKLEKSYRLHLLSNELHNVPENFLDQTYGIVGVKTSDAISSCVQVTVADWNRTNFRDYPICNVTSGFSNGAFVSNQRKNPDGTVSFDLLSQPSPRSHSNGINRYNVTGKLFEASGEPVSTFVYKIQQIGRLEGLQGHKIRSIQNVGDGIFVISSKESNGVVGLYENYFLGGDSSLSYQKKFTDDKTLFDHYDIHYYENGRRVKRIFDNFDTQKTSITDITYQESSLKLSNHTASAHTNNTFELRFNELTTLKPIQLALDKFYPDDGKTDDDDRKPTDDDDDDPKPNDKALPSRLWMIFGVLLILLIIGILDLYLRKRPQKTELDMKLVEDNNEPTLNQTSKAEQADTTSRPQNNRTRGDATNSLADKL